MSKYILTITVISIVSSFVYIASPVNFKKYITLLSSLIMIILVALPLKHITKPEEVWGHVINADKEYKQIDSNELAAEYLANSISAAINKQYKINVKKITVQVNEVSTFDVDVVKVFVEPSNIDASIISEQIRDLYNCKIEIYQEE